MEAWLASLLIRHRAWFVLASVLAVAAIASGARYVWFDADYRIFFKPDNPQLVAHERLQSEFTRSDNVSFILAPKDGDVFTRTTLSAIEALTAQAWTLPYSVRVDSVTNFQHTRAQGDDLAVADLVKDARGLTDEQLADIRRLALAEPLLVAAVVSARGHVAAVNVRLALPEQRGAPDTAAPQVMEAVRAMRERFVAEHPGIDVHLMGLVPVNVAFNELAQRDSSTLVPIMFAIVVLTLLLFLRSVSAVLTTVLVIVFSLAVAVGFMGWAGYQANQINVSAPTLILTLAVSDSVHLLLSYLEGLGRGLSKPDAMEDSLRVNIAPVFFTNFTTAVGFIGLNYSDSPPFLEMGNIAAVGVMATMVLSFTLLPGVMVALPIRIRPGWPPCSRVIDPSA